MRRLMTTLCVLVAVSGIGCAGPDKLAQKSGNKLAEGDVWKAWQLATQALDKAPANPHARVAASAAAASIAEDWQRRITALAAVDSTNAAEQVLAFVKFRTDAIPYTTVHVSDAWMADETRLRAGAAQRHYAEGVVAARSRRPKKAYAQFLEAERFVSDYRDASERADVVLRQATTRVAVLPLASLTGDVNLGRAIAEEWSGSLVEHMPASDYFTHILPADEVERALSVADLGRTSRADAIRLGAKVGADRVVWGSIGAVDAHSGVHFFQRSIWHLASGRDAAGHTTSSWVEVPLQVVSRTRTVSVDLAYEVISTRGGATLAREHSARNIDARTVWTSYTPDGGPDTYALVTDDMRRTDPDGCRKIESVWAQAVGASTTLAQVLTAKRDRAKHAADPAEVLARYAAGAAFVMLEDLPSTQDLTHAALSASWQPVQHTLVQLDPVDDLDLDAISAGETGN
jgi:hypothetical protein